MSKIVWPRAMKKAKLGQVILATDNILLVKSFPSLYRSAGRRSRPFYDIYIFTAGLLLSSPSSLSRPNLTCPTASDFVSRNTSETAATDTSSRRAI